MALPGAVVADRAGDRSRASWRRALPTLVTSRAILREVVPADARALTSALVTPEVQRYLPVGPPDEAGFRRFIRWVRRERRAGRYVCFAVVPRASGAAAGLFQLWPIEPGFGTAELGFAIGRTLWGTGLFQECGTRVSDIAIQTLGVRRIECRSATVNHRGAASLRKLGAVEEGTLRACFLCPGGYLDHTMWSILADDWCHREKRGAA